MQTHEATSDTKSYLSPHCSSCQDVEILAGSMQKSVLSLSTVYYWLPKSQGKMTHLLPDRPGHRNSLTLSMPDWF